MVLVFGDHGGDSFVILTLEALARDGLGTSSTVYKASSDTA